MKIAMLYDDDAYLEIPDRQKDGKSVPRGLWGRHVAGKEFFDAYLTHGKWDELVALVRNRASRESVVRLCHEHASNRVRERRLRVFSEQHFFDDFFPGAPATLLYTPQPPDERYAWAREHGGPGSYALCGVTHTLCSARANRWLISLVTAPFEEYDALVCTSQAVVDMVRTVIDSYTEHLRHRYGGHPRLKPRLELIPLGVNTDRFRPATPEQRLAHRQGLRVHDDEVVVLFVGRLAAHGKAHPCEISITRQDAAT
jgi:glycosyltransferase involved in cell wall biosynthesis